jgi:hypothetical protein
MNVDEKMNILIKKGYTVFYVAQYTGSIIFSRDGFRVGFHLETGAVWSYKRY